MGTDIRVDVIVHSHTDGEGEWWLEAIQSAGLLLGRDYEFFCQLAGIRCSKSVVRESFWSRGLPPGCPLEVASMHSDREAPTWLRPEEFLPLVAAKRKDEYDWGWTVLEEAVRIIREGVGDNRVRIVLSFAT